MPSRPLIAGLASSVILSATIATSAVTPPLQPAITRHERSITTTPLVATGQANHVSPPPSIDRAFITSPLVAEGERSQTPAPSTVRTFTTTPLVAEGQKV